MNRTPRLLAARVQVFLPFLVLSLMGGVFAPVAGDVKRYLYRGEVLEDPITRPEQEWLEARKKEQLKTLHKFKVDFKFQFQDRLVESQITFKHNVVDDAGRDYKAIHYDHGSGLAAADVDGDGLIDLYFVNQLGSNELWRNLGNGRFENITELAGVAMAGHVNVSASFADIDNDGDPDLYVTSVRTGNALFENLGKGRFREITQSAGLTYSGHSSGAVFFDYNRDGLVDLLLTNVGHYTTDQRGRGGYFIGTSDGFTGHLHQDRSEPCILYENVGNNKFIDVTAKVGLRNFGWSGDASFADLNQNGFPDLYVLNMQGNDHFFENVQGKRFVDRTESHFPKTPWGSMGIKFFDYNNDGLLDLFLTDMHSDMGEDIAYDDYETEKQKSAMKWDMSVMTGHEKSILGNAFYKNLGAGKFTEISDELGVENYWPWGVSVDDLNADGYADIFVTASMNYMFRYGINSLLLNNLGQRFLDSEFILGVEPRRGGKTATPWFDVDCSGADKDYWDCKNRTGKFTVMGALGSRSSVIFDLDNDGDLDIVTNEFNSAPQILISNLAEKHPIHFLKIDLKGTLSNRNGLGAKVTVTAGNLTITRWQDGKSGYLSQSVLPLYFGLGKATQVDRVEVLWPSGVRQTVDKPAVRNSVLLIVETKAN
ncbi:MAG: CRTAC1 family protein [Terriglobia bacterium]